MFLVNTGWTGGPYGVGNRMDLKHTRSMIKAALNGELDHVEYEKDPVFNLAMPLSCSNVPKNILNPKNTWKDKDSYDQIAKKLAENFVQNIAKFPEISPEVLKAGPQIQ